jgi:hypothetical protein
MNENIRQDRTGKVRKRRTGQSNVEIKSKHETHVIDDANKVS